MFVEMSTMIELARSGKIGSRESNVVQQKRPARAVASRKCNAEHMIGTVKIRQARWHGELWHLKKVPSGAWFIVMAYQRTL